MIFPGESVRISAKPRSWGGTALDDVTTDKVTLNINDRKTHERIVIDAPVEYDSEAGEFVGFWITPREGEFIVTVTVQGKSRAHRSVQQRVIKVYPDNVGVKHATGFATPTEILPVTPEGVQTFFTGHGPPTDDWAAPIGATYLDLDTNIIYVKE